MSKTIVYIDVDGVINSFHKAEKTGWTGEWKWASVNGYIIHWYTDLIDALHELDSRDDVEMKWLTTWQDDAVTQLSPALGIKGTEWEVMYVPEGEELFDRFSWWKLHAIKDDIAKHRPDKVVWIDDDFKYERNAIGWVEDNPEINLLPISPFTDWGMTKEDFDDIIEFINA